MSNESGVGAEPPALTDEQIVAIAAKAIARPYKYDAEDIIDFARALIAALSAAPIGVPADLPPGTCVGAAGTRCLMKDTGR